MKSMRIKRKRNSMMSSTQSKSKSRNKYKSQKSVRNKSTKSTKSRRNSFTTERFEMFSVKDLVNFRFNDDIQKQTVLKTNILKQDYQEFEFIGQFTILASFPQSRKKKSSQIRQFEAMPKLELNQYKDLFPKDMDPLELDIEKWEEFFIQFYQKDRTVRFTHDSRKDKSFLQKRIERAFNNQKFDSSIMMFIGKGKAGQFIINSKKGEQSIDFLEVYQFWKNRQSKQKHLLLILDFNNCGKWVKEFSKLTEKDDSISIQASCKANERSKICEIGGYFTHNCIKFLNRHSMEKLCVPDKQDLAFAGNYLNLKKFTNLYFKFNSWKEMQKIFKSETVKLEMTHGSYFGYQQDGMKNHWGLLIIRRGKKQMSYEGEFKNGKFDGKGILKLPSKKVYEGEFKNNSIHGMCKEIFITGDIYEGQFIRNVRLGKGTYYFQNGDIYKGEFRKNMPNGQGTIILKNKNVYTGELKDGDIHGQGEIKYYNGDHYIGEWKKNLKHGQGIYTDIKGNVYKGSFLNGKKHGYGVFNGIDGSKYDGEWTNGKKDGAGVYWEKNGNKMQGNWVNNDIDNHIVFYEKTGTNRVYYRNK